MNIKSAHFLPGTNKRLGDKYLLLECLGDGSHGWVWRAERLADGQIVAVKIPKDITREDRQLAEGKELVGVEPHPNVISIYDMGRIDNEWFFIEMEYFPSETLAQKLDNRKRNFGQTYERLLGIYSQVLEAVRYLTELSTPISHGDIKPHNILIGERDLVKLTDFGSSALPEEIYVRTRENGGTVLYSAPEYSNVDCRKGSQCDLMFGDIYSLGVLLYQLLTGQLPHDTPAQVQRHAPFKRPTEVNHSIHPKLEALILRCLQKKPENRYQSLQDIISDFDTAKTAQLSHSTPIAIHQSQPGQDWSSAVLSAMEDQSYQEAAKIAAQEFKQSKDVLALGHQLNALHRADRLFDFEKVVDEQHASILSILSDETTGLSFLIVKVFLKLRNIKQARFWLNAALEKQGESLGLKHLRATLLGLEADYSGARLLLEEINQTTPMKANILGQLVQVCEQMRDYSAAAAYLKAASRMNPENLELQDKRAFYNKLGVM